MATAMIFCLIFVVPSLDSLPLLEIFVEDFLFKGFFCQYGMQLLLDRYLSTIRFPLNMFLASTASQLVLGTGRDLLMSREFCGAP